MFPGQVGAQAVLRFSTRLNNSSKVMKLRSECRVNFFHLLVDYVKKTSVFSLDMNYHVIRWNGRCLYIRVGRWNAISQKFRVTIVLKFADGDFSKKLFIIYIYSYVLLYFLKN